MREKIAKINYEANSGRSWEIREEYAHSLDGIMVEETCPECTNRSGKEPLRPDLVVCPQCNGTGTITRKADPEEIMEFVTRYLSWCEYFTKSGGRLRVKE